MTPHLANADTSSREDPVREGDVRASQSQPVTVTPKSATEGAAPAGPVKPSEVLTRAADRIELAGRWVQFVAASSEYTADLERLEEAEVAEWSDRAVCWCAAGAVWRESPRGRCGEALRHRAIGYLMQIVGVVADFNDEPDRTQAEVVAALRKAADLARAAEASEPEVAGEAAPSMAGSGRDQ